jgi:catechol 2,3-dioxygenase-like lactoylglutathione lyase family enzyme
MRVTNIVPVIGVKDMAATIAFYHDLLGFEVVHQTGWYAHLRAAGGSAEIGFVISHHPMQPEVFQAPFEGSGLFYSFEVDDVDAEYQRLRDAGMAINLELRDEPWGERHFAVRDPNGVYINVSHTESSQRGKVDYREHMRQLEKGVRPAEGKRVPQRAAQGGK